MSFFRLTRSAENDMIAIGQHSRQHWGTDQAHRYLTQLDECFHMLATHPALGAEASEIRAGYRRYPQGQHVVFYRSVETGIEVVRVLHRRMLPKHHIQDD